MKIGKIIGFGCLGIIVVFFGLAVLGSMMNGSKSPTNTSSTSSTAANSSTAPSTSTAPAPAPASTTKSAYGVGDTIKLSDREIVITSVDKDYSSGNQFDKPRSSDNSYVLIDVAFTNTGNKEISVNPYNFKLEDETGTQRDVTFAVADGPLESVSLSAGGKTSGKIAFEAKKDSATLKLIYSPGLFSDDIIINL